MSEIDISSDADLEGESLDDLLREVETFSGNMRKGAVYWINEDGIPATLFHFDVNEDAQTLGFSFSQIGRLIVGKSLGVAPPPGEKATVGLFTGSGENRLTSFLDVRGIDPTEPLVEQLIEKTHRGAGRFVVAADDLHLHSSISSPMPISPKQIMAEQSPWGLAGRQSELGRPVYLQDSSGLHEVILKKPSLGGDHGQDPSLMLKIEHACLETLRKNGIPAAESKLVGREGDFALAVKRFDRSTAPNGTDLTQQNMRKGRAFYTLDNIRQWQEGETCGFSGEDAYFKSLTGINKGDASERNTTLASVLIFNKLIGNQDLHGSNLGYFLKPTKEGRLRPEPAPFFDIGPYMLENQDQMTVQESGLAGKALFRLSDDDLASSSRTLRWFREKHPEAFAEAAKKARQMQVELIQMVTRDMVNAGIIEKEKALGFVEYLNRPIGHSAVRTNPFGAGTGNSGFRKNRPDLVAAGHQEASQLQQ